jgi:hypothetical protein
MKSIPDKRGHLIMRVAADIATLVVGMSFVLVTNANAGPQGAIVIKQPVVVAPAVAVAPAAVPAAIPAVAPVAVPVVAPVAVPVAVPVVTPVFTPFFNPFFSPFFDPFFGFDPFFD